MTLLGSEPEGHGIAARVYPDSRSASRVAAQRRITLRPPGNEPVDAVVEDLSRSGFAMSTVASLAIGSVVGLSLSGVVRRRVRVVRRVGLAYGCEFLSPLSEMELKAALLSGDVIATNFGTEYAFPSGDDGLPRTSGRKLSHLARAYILGTVVISLWIALILVGRRLL